MVTTDEKLYTVEEYFERERYSDEKWEYNNGIITKMAGATLFHNLIASNLITMLNNALEQKEKAYLVLNSDMKINIPKENKYVYPDAVVICEKPELYNNRLDIIVNPLVVVEVLSFGTEEYDRNGKFSSYKTIPSFQEYLMVKQYAPAVTASYKIADRTWQDTEAEGVAQTIYLRSLDIALDLKRIYKGVTFRELV